MVATFSGEKVGTEPRFLTLQKHHTNQGLKVSRFRRRWKREVLRESLFSRARSEFAPRIALAGKVFWLACTARRLVIFSLKRRNEPWGEIDQSLPRCGGFSHGASIAAIFIFALFFSSARPARGAIMYKLGAPAGRPKHGQ